VNASESPITITLFGGQVRKVFIADPLHTRVDAPRALYSNFASWDGARRPGDAAVVEDHGHDRDAAQAVEAGEVRQRDVRASWGGGGAPAHPLCVSRPGVRAA
jgi:hypothetical protein